MQIHGQTLFKCFEHVLNLFPNMFGYFEHVLNTFVCNHVCPWICTLKVPFLGQRNMFKTLKHVWHKFVRKQKFVCLIFLRKHVCLPVFWKTCLPVNRKICRFTCLFGKNMFVCPLICTFKNSHFFRAHPPFPLPLKLNSM